MSQTVTIVLQKDMEDLRSPESSDTDVDAGVTAAELTSCSRQQHS